MFNGGFLPFTGHSQGDLGTLCAQEGFEDKSALIGVGQNTVLGQGLTQLNKRFVQGEDALVDVAELFCVLNDFMGCHVFVAIENFIRGVTFVFWGVGEREEAFHFQ